MDNVKDFGDYSVKNIKTFMGREGHGFNANLYRGKKKIAFVIDDASGGEVDVDWTVGIPPKNKADYPTEKAYDKAWDSYRNARKEEADLLNAHLAKLPKVKSSFGDGKMELTVDSDWFVTELVARWGKEKAEKKIERDCKTKTLFRLEGDKTGQHWIVKAPFDEQVRAYLNKKHGDKLLEIINDRYK